MARDDRRVGQVGDDGTAVGVRPEVVEQTQGDAVDATVAGDEGGELIPFGGFGDESVGSWVG